MRASALAALGLAAWLVALAGLPMALAGCSRQPPQPPPEAGDATPAPPAPRADAPALPESQRPPAEHRPDLKVGLLLPLSDVYAPLGQSMANAYEMYFDEIGGQVSGRRVVLIPADTAARPDVARRRAERLVGYDGVDLVTGIVHSGVVDALQEFFHARQQVLIVSAAGGGTPAGGAPGGGAPHSPYLLRTSFRHGDPGRAMGAWAAANIGPTAVALGPEYAAGRETVAGFVAGFTAGGGRVVQEQYAELGAADFSPLLAAVAQADPDLLFVAFSGLDAVRFLEQYAAAGLQGRIPLTATGFTLTEAVVERAGPAAMGHWSALHWDYGLDTPANRQFVAAYEARYGERPDVFAVQAYETAYLIHKGVEQAGGQTGDREALSQALAKVAISGPRGTHRLDPVTGEISQAFYIRRVQNVDGTVRNVVVDRVEPVLPGEDSGG